jgi:hypothetical protein
MAQGAIVTVGRIVMLHKITIGCAVVVAMLALPVTLSARSMGGGGGMHGFSGGGMHGFGGGMHGFSGAGMHGFGGVHSFGGPRNFGTASRVGGVHTFNHGAFFARDRFAHFDRFHRFHRFDHFHHFRHRHNFAFFATAIDVGYDSCWQWVPTRYGWHRVWVCDPYY